MRASVPGFDVCVCVFVAARINFHGLQSAVRVRACIFLIALKRRSLIRHIRERQPTRGLKCMPPTSIHRDDAMRGDGSTATTPTN